jgi:thiamine biosynthesis lipoprotein ApbE
VPLALLLVTSLAVDAAPAAAAGETKSSAAPTMTVVGSAFGASLEMEALAARDSEKALLAALAAIQDFETATDGSRGALAELNRGAGAGPRKVEPTLLATLNRALAFCVWSDGTLGPLGGPLNEIWGLRHPRPGLPTTAALEQAIAAAACDRLSVDAAKGTATLAAGAQVDLWSFEAGAALDRAADMLAARGVRDASLTLGNVQRAVGAGPGGRGWPLRIAVPPALSPFTDNLRLRDQSFALASREDGELRAGGERYAPYLDQRSGRPVTGVLATAALTQLALDAQGLAATLFVTGPRRGGMMLGQLQPTPAALWVLGDGSGEPLVSDYRWGGHQRRGGR